MCEKTIFNQWHIRMAHSQMERMPVLSEKWTYDYGVVLNGMQLMYELTGEKEYFDYVQSSMDSFLNADGTAIRGYRISEYNIDHINNGKNLLWLYDHTGDARYKNACDLLIRQLKTHPRTSEGGFWHKQIYPYQMWLDGIYMGAPFYAAYAKRFLSDAFTDDAAKQVLLCYRHTLDAKTGLCYHAWDEKRAQFWCDPATGLSPNFWGRSLGWFMAAVADFLDILPADHKDRPAILSLFESLARALLRVRDVKTRVWYQVPDQGKRPGNYLESSASSLITYAMAHGARMGYLPPSFKDEAVRQYEGIVTQFIEEYKGQACIMKCCQVAGLGGDSMRDGTFAYYMSEPIIMNDLKAVGGFLQCAAEIEGYR